MLGRLKFFFGDNKGRGCAGYGLKIGEPQTPLSERLYPIDTKAFILKESNRISPEIVDLYKKGWSLRDIAREYGCSRHKVYSQVKKAGVKLRENSAQATPNRKNGVKQNVLPYYGFCYFEGRITPDPREFPALKLIHRLWKDQRTIHQITLELNRVKIPSRQRKQWSWAAVKNIVQRFEQGIVTLHGGSRYKLNSFSKK